MTDTAERDPLPTPTPDAEVPAPPLARHDPTLFAARRELLGLAVAGSFVAYDNRPPDFARPTVSVSVARDCDAHAGAEALDAALAGGRAFAGREVVTARVECGRDGAFDIATAADASLVDVAAALAALEHLYHRASASESPARRIFADLHRHLGEG